MERSDLSTQAEAFLFSEGGSLSLRKLAQLLEAKQEEVSKALDELEARLQDGGITLVRTKDEAALVISESASSAVADAYQRELGREIGDAGLEVLAIILYRGDSTRAEIDYIRGVNTSSTLRLLLSRGLVQRVGNPKDGREYLYRPTAELLAHLGARNAAELPEYAKIASELAAFEQKQGIFADNGGTDDTSGAADE